MARKLQPTDPVDITAEMADGTTHHATTTQRLWMCLADRVQFERRFATSFAELRLAQAVGTVHDEWIAFFCWRVLARGVPALAEVSFDAFCEDLVSLELDEHLPEDEPAEPADPASAAAAPDPTRESVPAP